MSEDRPNFDRLSSIVPTISVGLLTADLMRLGEELEQLAGVDLQLLHFDVMDGCFAPGMTVGAPFIKGIKTPLLKDVHLMIEDPVEKLEDYVAAGADLVTVHVESTRHIHRAFQTLESLSTRYEREIIRGIALNPGTSLETVEPLLGMVETITLVGINPGWSGQSICPKTRDRLQRVRGMVRRSGRRILTCVDGGIKKSNIEEIASWQPDIVVTGSAVFDGRDPAANARFMLDSLRPSE